MHTFIAQHAPPALLAYALPGAVAGAVHAARVAVALRARGSRPAHLAAALPGAPAVAALAVTARGANCWNKKIGDNFLQVCS